MEIQLENRKVREDSAMTTESELTREMLDDLERQMAMGSENAGNDFVDAAFAKTKITAKILIDAARRSIEARKILEWGVVHDQIGGPGTLTVVLEACEALGVETAASASASARCRVTGNPVGTDTRMVGHPCPCEVCSPLVAPASDTEKIGKQVRGWEDTQSVTTVLRETFFPASPSPSEEEKYPRHARDCLYVTSDGPAPCTCGYYKPAQEPLDVAEVMKRLRWALPVDEPIRGPLNTGEYDLIRDAIDALAHLQAENEAWKDQTEGLQAEVTAQDATIARLRAALVPFQTNVEANSLSSALGHITREHLWAARVALSEAE